MKNSWLATAIVLLSSVLILIVAPVALATVDDGTTGPVATGTGSPVLAITATGAALAGGGYFIRRIK